jgi:Tol biopolymer transport system component
MKRPVASLFVALLIAAYLPGCAYITRASQSSSGGQADSWSNSPSVSADGRWVAFNSAASNLVPGDTNGTTDVFVRDNLTKQVARISVADNGTQGDGHSSFPSISDDGRWVAFASDATNLDAGDTNGQQDIYVHDRDYDNDGLFDETGAIWTGIVSLTTTGSFPTTGYSTLPVISGDGHVIVYESTATLAPEDTNGQMDVYTTNLSGGFPITRLISKPVGGGGPANGLSDQPTVNLDGTVVAFETAATNLVAGDTNGKFDVVIVDSHTAPPTMARATGAVLADADVLLPSLSRDGAGRFVAFASAASNLVPPKGNATLEVYVLDRDTGAITAESRPPFGFADPDGNSLYAKVSADGNRVAFHSSATNLVADDTNGQPDIFVRDRASDLTQRASTGSMLDQSDNGSQVPAISTDGNYVAFDSVATNLVAGDTNGAQDVFTRGAIVPQIDSVNRLAGPYLWAPHLPWGPTSLRITGRGFGSNISVDLGADVTILGMTHAPTQIVLQLAVTDGSTGARNVVVKNLATPGVAGGASTRVCVACLSIQRWVTNPDPIPYPYGGLAIAVGLLSHNEFTPSTRAQGYGTSYSSGDALVLVIPDGSPHGASDLTLTDTVNGTVTCAGCLHLG